MGYRRGGRRRADRGLGSPLGLWAQKERRAWGQRVHTMKVPGWGFRCGLEAFKGGMGGGGERNRVQQGSQLRSVPRQALNRGPNRRDTEQEGGSTEPYQHWRWKAAGQ